MSTPIPEYSPIKHIDEVIEHAARASANHSGTVRSALSAYVTEQSHATTHGLRVALVAQAAGHEPVAGDGATFSDRVAAAKAALAAWDRSGR